MSSRLTKVAAGLALLVVAVGAGSHDAVRTAAAGCANAIACENQLPGDPESDWGVSGAGDPSIQGFATAMSIQPGATVHFKVKTPAAKWHFDVLRFGYYQGNGARKLAASLPPSAVLPQTQPTCLSDASTGLVDCGNWAESASWQVPSTAVSGIYFALLTRDDTGGQSQIAWVVRDDSSHSSVLFQTSDESWQAYNDYGGNSLYTGGPAGRAYKVSYNRPCNCAVDDQGRSWVLYAEYPMIRYLERNGYDVSYTSGSDVDARASVLTQHKVFMSVGHDEYWSGNQRANVEAALAAGVNLAFLSGNEVFWKTRWENSIDGSGTPYRTLVTYKETHANAVIDPADPSTWTGTWRDPRFSPPADGGRPENALKGTLFTDEGDTTAIQVPAQYANLRFWRNTSIASLPPGQTATLASRTLGYEWDSDVDNGFRPAGLFDLSFTTVANAQDKIQDHGSTYAPGSLNHSLTLYRASSGALVFSAGTVQWTWGLDPGSVSSTVDVRMQQATVNMLADMGVQPATLMAGLTAATQTTDATPPTSVITSPAAGATLSNGSVAVVSGTAADAGGSVVAAVEVSTDNGTTWHRATGTTSWTYSWVVNTGTATTIRSRAVDDSGNIETPSGGVAVTGTCPCSLFGSGGSPAFTATADSSSVEVGVKFRSDVNGSVTGIRFYKGAANTGTHTGHLWSSSGQLLASLTFTGETVSGWQSATLSSWVPIVAGATYVVSYHAPNGHYASTPFFFDGVPVTDGPRRVDSPPLHALNSGVDGPDGVFAYGGSGTFPGNSFQSTNYWVDVTFTGSSQPPTLPSAPANVVATAAHGAAQVSWTLPDSGNSQVTQYTVTPYAGSTALAPITVTGAPAPRSATVGGLSDGTAHTFTVSATNAVGTGPTSPASNAVTPQRTIVDFTIPATVDSGDGSAVELGVKFTTDVAGTVTGVRFYKAALDTGTHVGQLYSATGTLLASATATTESATGWQQITFSAPVSITAQTVFVAGFYAPNGHYSLTASGLANGINNAPLHGVADSTRPNGVYAYGGSPSFPTGSYRASEYGVDVLFSPGAAVNTAPGAPTGVSASAGNGSATVTWTSPGDGGSPITSYTVTPYIGSTAQTPTTVSGSPPATTATVTGLTNNTAYTFTVAATNALGTGPASAQSAPVSPSTSVSLYGTHVPSMVDANDGNAVELGVAFTSDVTGYVTALRFYKAAANTGTHVGSLWTASGTKLASVTYTSETASGWQQVSIPGGVAIAANTTYIVSHFAPKGHYSVTPGGLATAGVDNPPLHAPATTTTPNGVYIYTGTSAFPTSSYQGSAYGVDLVFSPSAPPSVPPSAPAGVVAIAANGAAQISWTAPGNGGSPITVYTVTPYVGTTAQATTTVTGNPPAPAAVVTGLAIGTTYTFTVTATNASGTGPASAASNPVTEADTILGLSAPAVADAGDGGSVNLGVKFRSDVTAHVTGIRFYKSAANTGTHVGALWSSDGTLLASATFTNESATGWQTVTFSTPVAITAGTTYIASYLAPNGHYAATGQAFNPNGIDTPPLHALADGGSGGDGVYVYGSASAFPSASYNATDYWVDVVVTTP